MIGRFAAAKCTLSEIGKIGYTESLCEYKQNFFYPVLHVYPPTTVDSIHVFPTSSSFVPPTNFIIWKVDDEKTLTICPQFNQNPETCTSVASVVVYQSDDKKIPYKVVF